MYEKIQFRFMKYKPLKNLPIAMKSSWSEQLNTTHWIAIALARSCVYCVCVIGEKWKLQYVTCVCIA